MRPSENHGKGDSRRETGTVQGRTQRTNPAEPGAVITSTATAPGRVRSGGAGHRPPRRTCQNHAFLDHQSIDSRVLRTGAIIGGASARPPPYAKRSTSAGYDQDHTGYECQHGQDEALVLKGNVEEVNNGVEEKPETKEPKTETANRRTCHGYERRLRKRGHERQPR